MSLWQTHAWQEMLKNSGQTQDFFVLDDVYAEKRKISFGRFGLFITGISPDQLNPSVVHKLKDIAKNNNCIFTQLEFIEYPHLTEPPSYDRNYKKFIPPYTIHINLHQDEEEIFSAMREKGRYNIRRSQKFEVYVEMVEKSQENIRIFYDLMCETTKRDGFAGNTKAYYQEFLKLSGSELIFAMKDKEVLAAGIFTFSGDVAYYYYGASVSDKVKAKFMSPYALQWFGIQEAKKRGCSYYDFLGIAGDNEKKSSLAGVTQFKTRFSRENYLVSRSELFIHNFFIFYAIELLKKIKSAIGS